MLSTRILNTLKFFDLQSVPLTLLELQVFLLNDFEQIKSRINSNFELENLSAGEYPEITPDQILICLETELKEQVECHSGYYCLKGREKIIQLRLSSYLYGYGRERRIRRYVGFLKHLPFVRGVALGGSQALGQQTEHSDIDLFIITEQNFLWIARTFVTVYFQILGMRRHGGKIANRFCLNHYLAGPKQLSTGRDLYNAMEYLRLRPLVYPQATNVFLTENFSWMNSFMPNKSTFWLKAQDQSAVQKWLEKFFAGNFGQWVESKLAAWQLKRIRRGEYVRAETEEIAFHSIDRKRKLLKDFFQTAG